MTTQFTACASTYDVVMENLKSDLQIVLDWFKVNQMIANPSKFQFMILGSKCQTPTMNIAGALITASKTVKLLGIQIDHELKFYSHILNLCRTANAKLKCLARIRNRIDNHQAKLLCNSFILSQFNYCPLIWMFMRIKR